MARQLEDLRADIRCLSTEDLMKRVMESRQRRRAFPAEKKKAVARKETKLDMSKMGTDELLKLLEILEGEE